MNSSSLPTLGRYEIIRVLGRGAMGLVYEARDPNLDRRVAIKTIRVDGLSADAADEYAARFRTEARSAARLQHPNIVSVYDSDRDGEVAYLVMEYVQGEDLKHHLDAGTRFTLEQTLRIAADLLAALDYAHRQSIVHRDIKPANLLLEASGRVKLADFGVARIQDTGEATRTRGSMVGTLKYMSPEQVQGQPVDARADLFAAGVVLYQLLTGRRPFEGDTDFAIIHQIVAQPLVPASSLNPQLPVALDAVLAQAMAKSREDRYATARDFVQALQEACGSLVDRTILAPAFQGSSAGTGSAAGLRGGSRSGSTTVPFGVRTAEDTGATVTQELELVYWKDVRDSPDAADLEGFLARFPQGIYADLARRRLRRLAGQDTGTSATAYDATRMDAPTTLGGTLAGMVPAGGTAVPGPVAPPPAPLPASPPAPQVDEAGRAAPDGAGMSTSALPDAPGPARGHQAPAVAPSSAPAQAALPEPPAARRGPRGLVWAALGAVAVVAVLAYQGLGSGDAPAGGNDATATAAEVPASAASASAGMAEAPLPEATPVSAAAAVTAGPVLAASEAAPAASAASAARNTLARAQPRQGAASGPVPAPAPNAAASSALPVASSALADGARVGATAAPATPPAAPPVRPAARPAAASPTDPAQACQGRVLLGYQICLNEQCALPAFAQHAVCVERREAEKIRRERFGNERN